MEKMTTSQRKTTLRIMYVMIFVIALYIGHQPVRGAEQMHVTEGVLQSAHGGGTAIEFDRRSTFVFNAVRHVNGSVTGTLVYMFRDFGLDYKVHMDLDCLIIEGNRAKVSGLITKVTANVPIPPFAGVGSRASLQVEDNGSGGSGSPDKYSDLHGFEAMCGDDLDPYIPIDGNIVINP